MGRIVTTILLLLMLFGYSGLTGSAAAASTGAQSTGGSESRLQCSPDLDPGCPFGWPRGLQNPRPSFNYQVPQRPFSNGDLHDKDSGPYRRPICCY